MDRVWSYLNGEQIFWIIIRRKTRLWDQDCIHVSLCWGSFHFFQISFIFEFEFFAQSPFVIFHFHFIFKQWNCLKLILILLKLFLILLLKVKNLFFVAIGWALVSQVGSKHNLQRMQNQWTLQLKLAYQ